MLNQNELTMETKTETVTIKIRKQTNGTGLYLKDSEGHKGKDSITTDVNPGDTVVWKLKNNSGIDEITSISAKSTSQDIFSSDPVEQKDGSWKGTVSSTASGSEDYSIGYKIGGTDYTDDPQLNVQN